MEIYSAKDVEKTYRNVSYIQQVVECSGGVPVSPCKHFSSEKHPEAIRFLPQFGDIPGRDLQKTLDKAITRGELFLEATSRGISEENAEAAIWPGTRKFYAGPKWLVESAAYCD